MPGAGEREQIVDSEKGVADGIRTRDRRDHNAELYQLSYSHLAGPNLACGAGGGRRGCRSRATFAVPSRS
jgi:hypothetical protein